MIRKYHSFLEARLDLYREMWKREFSWQTAKKFHNDFERFCKKNNLSVIKPLYPPGIYFFKSIKEARKDVMKKIIRNACERI